MPQFHRPKIASLTVPHSDKHIRRVINGSSRRQWLHAGGLTAVGGMGVSLPGLLAARESEQADSPRLDAFGRAKSCIILFLFGAPAHQDTWDLKPEAPREVRGEFQPIATSVPGTHVGEHIPRLASIADRYALLRSVTHPDNTHTVAMHYMLTGVRHRRPKTNPQNAADDFPCFGSVMNHHLRGAARAPGGLPPAVSLNAPANQVSANNHIFPGFFAGFLGKEHDPLFISQHADEEDFHPFESTGSRQRLVDRGRLLEEFERDASRFRTVSNVNDFSAYQSQALDLLTSPAALRAFDVSSESDSVRDRFGITPFGQGCLLGRRLIQAGVPLVTVNWERDDAYWDTHSDNFNKHRNSLLPSLDHSFSALLLDLEERGLLDETLVVCLSEFGRTPKINGNAGRDHWAPCNTVVLAGAGITGGQVYGASDAQAAYPVERPVSPEDLSATIYHLLGIDTDTTLRTQEGQPVRLSHGSPLFELWA
ncbi:MAG: DUF1501 domain-containing protein [Planctomycetota bacterium]|nr:MAG: DUF1501 domain-containing protein [Planctomycetota bacterium]REK27529.1 MAG: DUF1501 domain-containing protein [Planctomycetota bacterium]